MMWCTVFLVMLYLCYSAYRKRPRNDEGEKELINISSDDDLSKNGDEDPPVQKSQCSVATVVKADIQPSAHAKVSVNVLYIVTHSPTDALYIGLIDHENLHQNFIWKLLLYVSVYDRHQGNFHLSLAKVTFINSRKEYVVIDCAVVWQRVISSPWWCVCCVLCTVRCALCSMQSETGSHSAQHTRHHGLDITRCHTTA